MLKLQQLDLLTAVIDHGSFSAAAAALGSTQSRISHAIQELETTSAPGCSTGIAVAAPQPRQANR